MCHWFLAWSKLQVEPSWLAWWITHAKISLYTIHCKKKKKSLVLYLLQGQTKERAFLGNMDQQLKDNEGLVLPEPVSSKQNSWIRLYSKY